MFTVEKNLQFIVNDTNVGAVERAKYHYRETKPNNSTTVFVLEKANKNKDMNVKAFLKAIANPPMECIVQASTLQKKERADSGLGEPRGPATHGGNPRGALLVALAQEAVAQG